MNAAVQIRELKSGDYERLAELYHSIYPEYDSTAEELRFEDESLDRSKYTLKQYVTVDDEYVVAMGQYWHPPFMYHPLKFMMAIFVDPAWQRRGIGTALYERIMKELLDLGATTVRARTREDNAAGLSFLQNRGFGEKDRTWESRLQVQ